MLRSNRVPKEPTLHFERIAWKSGLTAVAGVDEVGRGAWAGPLIAAATVLPPEPARRAHLTRRLRSEGLVIRDSKQLQHQDRVRITEIVNELGLPSAIGIVEPAEIDELGLGSANRIALGRALGHLEFPVNHALVDAFRLDECPVTYESIIAGDRRCQTIALASIIAKVHRDLIMIALDHDFPDYGFAGHKGYGTATHTESLARFGVTPHHRRCFAPVARAMGLLDAAS